MPLQPHAGVDRRPRQRHARARRPFLELHEHQVPDLDEPVAVLVRAAGRAARDMVAMVVEDLGARAAGAGIAHAPEIVRRRDADDPLVRQPGNLLPDRRGVFVFREHGDQQPVLGQAVVARDQLPRIGDGGFLEVVAEAEIPQHLEERVMPGGVADIVQVVVLAAGADAFLRRGGADIGPLLLPGEDVLELDHARVGEHQCRVVARHQRRARHRRMAVAGKIIQEGGADVVAAGHGGQVFPSLSGGGDVDAKGWDVAQRRRSVTGRGKTPLKVARRSGRFQGKATVDDQPPLQAVRLCSLSAVGLKALTL